MGARRKKALPLAAPRPGELHETKVDGEWTTVLVVGIDPKVHTFYPSAERWWAVTVLLGAGTKVQYWGEYTSPSLWRRLP